jgi:hypothetical protein
LKCGGFLFHALILAVYVWFVNYIFTLASEETRAKMSAAKKGKPSLFRGKKRPGPSWNLGVKFSEERKQKMSKAGSERVRLYGNPFSGRKHTEEAKERMSLARLGRHFGPHSDETKRKMSRSRRAGNQSRGGDVGSAVRWSHGLSDETRAKLRDAWEKRGPVSEGTKMKMSIAAKARWERMRKICVAREVR